MGLAKMKYEGKIYDTNNCGKIKILDYVSSINVKIMFVETGHKSKTQIGQIKRGVVKDKLKSSLFDIGYFGEGRYSRKSYEKIYRTWYNMLVRCYDTKFQEKNPAYKGTTICKDWHNFQNYAKWHEENYIDDYHLDKDLLQQGVENKEYSPETSLFLPQKVNGFMSNIYSNNTSGFAGVSLHRQTKKYVVNINCFLTGKKLYLGLFSSTTEAGQTYLKARAEQVEHAKQYMRDLGHYSEEVISKLK